MRTQSYPKYRGFTLVELLVVITIIGVLASLAAGGAWIVRIRVIEAMTKTQLSQMEMALEAYKNEFGEYPPMLNDKEAVKRHANSRWKRASFPLDPPNGINDAHDFILHTIGLALDNKLTSDKEKEGANNDRIALSLTFWLGGLYVDGAYRGFNADLENPLVVGTQWVEPLFDFSEKNTELLEDETKPKLRFFAVNKQPVVYFRSMANGNYDDPSAPNRYLFGWRLNGGSNAVPYAKSQDVIGNFVWHGAKKYQLIHPGRDGNFGTKLGYRITGKDKDGNTETGISYEDYDNIVNFTETATLKGALNP